MMPEMTKIEHTTRMQVMQPGSVVTVVMKYSTIEKQRCGLENPDTSPETRMVNALTKKHDTHMGQVIPLDNCATEFPEMSVTKRLLLGVWGRLLGGNSERQESDSRSDPVVN